MKTTDHDVIVSIKSGQIDQFEFLVKKYSDPVFRFVKLKVKNHEDAEDLVQNVFISFYKAIDRFDESRSVKPYLYQIVRNELKMFYRSHKTTLPLKEEIVGTTEEITVFDQNDLRVLDKTEKEILLMAYEGISYAEIAEQLKKPLNTIRSIIRRARLKVKQEYEKT